jgi:hypothetical protein
LKIWREKWHRYLFVTSEAENQSFFHWLKKMFFFFFLEKKLFNAQAAWRIGHRIRLRI